MTDKKFKDILENLLKKDNRLVDKYNELNLAKIRELVDKTDEKLIELLLSNKDSKKNFFLKVKDILVFKQHDFKFFLDENQIDNSYTAFENRIGIASGNHLLKDNNDIVLNFPFKDCVLEGGQSTEEGTDEYYEFNREKENYELKKSQRKEVFFNEILALDEIDRLFEPKAFSNIKKYTSKGKEKVNNFKRDEDGIISDNLIIKGNNLLALHSLKGEFAGRIKLIYIDPPYNTNTDGFSYNDKFKQSTWLTFMKNRLEISKELLADEGVIFVQISDVRVSALRLLMDEIFGPNNFINHVTVKTRSPSGFKTVNLGVFETAEYLLIYGKNKNNWKYNPQFVKSQYDTNYKFEIINIDEKFSKWKIKNVEDIITDNDGFKTVKEAKDKLGLGVFNEKMSEYSLLNNHKVFRFTEINFDAGKETLAAKEQSLIEPEKVIEVQRVDKNNRYVLNGNEISFYSKKIREIDDEKTPTIMLTNIWTDIAWEGIAKEGGVKLKKGKKPEKLIRRIIDMSTSKGDIVLDYCLGSGTTAAVAHKMGRRYIGIEQLDYTENDSVKRLKNVIKGDSTGISKIINWKGGGSFIYLELSKWNEGAKEKINDCKSLKQLQMLLNELSEKYFLHYNVKFKEFKENIINESKFKKLPLKTQQEMFCKMLDLNQLYVNVSEMEDKKYGNSKEDITLTKWFYNLR